MNTNWKLDPDGPRDCLIIEDEPAVVETLKMYCENLGIFRNIVIAEDGQIASNKMINQRFALILIDINLPKKDGLSLLEDFNTMSNVNNLNNAVIISGELDRLKLQTAISSGVKNFIIKPFDEKTFQNKIKNALNLVIEK